ALIGEYSASREKTNATALHLHSSITSDDSLEVIARKLNREKELALEQTCALFDYARLQKIIEVISKAPFIQITGLGGSALVIELCRCSAVAFVFSRLALYSPINA
ncbi:hypothetical protein ACUOA5_50895, partial [Escherichia coli]